MQACEALGRVKAPLLSIAEYGCSAVLVASGSKRICSPLYVERTRREDVVLGQDGKWELRV